MATAILFFLILTQQGIAGESGDKLGIDMTVFDNIEDVEQVAIQRNIKSDAENVLVENNAFLSKQWTLEAIKKFYNENAGFCSNSQIHGEKVITCFRDIKYHKVKYRPIITFQFQPERQSSIAIREYAAVPMR